MRYLLIILLLTGCAKPVSEWTTESVKMKNVLGLSDCTRFLLHTGDSVEKVIRCPLSATTTTYQSGKVTVSNTVIDENPTEIEQTIEETANPVTITINGKTIDLNELK